MIHTTGRSNSAAIGFLVAGAFWFVIGASYGFVSATQLAAPEFFNNIAALVFGRSRPIHVNTVIYGFITSMLVGGAMYYVPALLRVRLWSQRMGWAALVLWQAAVISGPSTFSFGITQGSREYTEYVWLFDLAIIASVLLLLANLVMTVVNRRESSLFVSVWYVFGMLMWTAGVYPIGNVVWQPHAGALPGILDSIVLWFYGHNLVGLLLTPLAIGAAYFVIPRVVRAPLYSHTLSLIGFWSLVTLYTHIGGHHLLQAPIPNWLKTLSVIDSVAMVIPVGVALTNLWLTARGRGGMLWRDPAARFVVAGTVWYLITCIQGPVQSLPSVQKLTHFNNWVIGHAHIAVLGFSGYIALGAMWHILPLVTGRRVWSPRLVSLQFGLITFGLVGFFVVLTVAGLIQGAGWYQGQTVYNVLPMITPYMVLRAMLGVFIIVAAILGFINVVMTLARGERFTPMPIEEPSP